MLELPGRWLSGGGPGKLLGLSSLGGAVPQKQAEGMQKVELLVTQLLQMAASGSLSEHFCWTCKYAGLPNVARRLYCMQVKLIFGQYWHCII